MNEFPEDLNRDICIKELEKNQAAMLKEVRKNFYDAIKKAIENCDSYVKLDFPEKMWAENRVKLVQELLQRFGIIRIKQTNSEHDVRKSLQLGAKEIPKNISQVVIEFKRNESA